MKYPELYSFGPDGTLWTCVNGIDRRPATVEEREGYCRETPRPAAFPGPAPRRVPEPAAEPVELRIAV